MPIHAAPSPHVLEPRSLDASNPPPLGPMAAYVGALAELDDAERARLSEEDRAAVDRIRAFDVPALVGVSLELPRTLEAGREVTELLTRTFAFPFEWKLERPIFGALHKQAVLSFACDAPKDEASGQAMCLVARGPVTHVEGVALDTPEGAARLERVQRSFAATKDYRATLRSFSMRARIDRAVWANVQAPFL